MIAHPVFPYCPIISTGNLYEFRRKTGDLYYQNTSRAAGGWIAFARDRVIDPYAYWELNEYGIVYQREELRKIDGPLAEEEEWCDFWQFVRAIGKLIKVATSFYKECGYLGNVEITVQLQRVFREKLLFYKTYYDALGGFIAYDEREKQKCLDSEVLASTQRLPQDLVDREKFIDTVDELTDPLLWAFNIIVNVEGKRKLVEHILRAESL